MSQERCSLDMFCRAPAALPQMASCGACAPRQIQKQKLRLQTTRKTRAQNKCHLEQINEHWKRLLVPNAGDAAAVARHIMHNLRRTWLMMGADTCRARVTDPDSSRQKLDVAMLKQRNNAAEKTDVAHIATGSYVRRQVRYM